MGRAEYHASDHKPTVLQAEVLAEKLFYHTVRIMSNPKYFNPAQDFRDMTCISIYEIALDVWGKIHTANAIDYREGVEAANERLELQTFALAGIERFFLLQRAARSLFTKLRGKPSKFWFWANMAVELKDAARAWHAADRKRFAEYYASRQKEDLDGGDPARSGRRLNSSLGGQLSLAFG